MSTLPHHLQHTLLPEGYVVGPNDVIIGRGKRSTLNLGNRRFSDIIQATLEAYYAAARKVAKSEIITNVLTQVRADNGVGFIKLHNGSGRYLLVEDASCRIAIAQAFRDALAGTYKSSKQHKQIRRMHRTRVNKMEQTLAFASMQVRGLMNELGREEQVGRPTFEDERSNAPFPSLDTRSQSSDLLGILENQGTLQATSMSIPVAPMMQHEIFDLGPPAQNSSSLSLGYGEFQTHNIASGLTTWSPTVIPPSAGAFDSLYQKSGYTMTNFSNPFEPTPLLCPTEIHRHCASSPHAA